jgi:hypothetical protein
MERFEKKLCTLIPRIATPSTLCTTLRETASPAMYQELLHVKFLLNITKKLIMLIISPFQLTRLV